MIQYRAHAMSTSRESGTLIILTMIIVFAMATIGLSIAQTVLTQYTVSRQQLYADNAITAAEAGISAAIVQLNKDASFSSFRGGEQNLYSDTQRGKATYTVTVSQSGDNRIILSTGKAYKTTDNSQLTKTKTIRAVAAVKRDKITNSLIFGSGGVYLSQSAGLPKGDIYIRGQLQMEQNSFIGSTTQSVNLNMANIGCGTSSWPQSCGAASPPIQMLDFTTGSIYGTVCATNQPSPTTGIYPGPSGSGLVAGCTPRTSGAPTFNKKAFVQSVSSTPTDPNSLVCSFFSTTVTIPAGTRANGDLNIPSGCTVYLAGDLFITGNLIVNPGAVMRAADSVGTIKPTVVVNKGFSFSAGPGINNMFLQNSSGTPFFLIAFASANDTCSNSETVPSDTVQTCLTPAEAEQSAALTAYGGGGGGTMILNATGAILYGYYASLSISPNAVAQFYAVGMQGAWLGAGTQITTVADDAPFGNILSFPSYQVADYQQLY